MRIGLRAVAISNVTLVTTSKKSNETPRAVSPNDDTVVPTPEWSTINPKVLDDPNARRRLRRWARRLSRVAFDGEEFSHISAIRAGVRDDAASLRAVVQPAFLFTASVLCDLRAQGWHLRVDRGGIHVAGPTPERESAPERKAQVKAMHLLERDAQLRAPATRAFINNMERRRLGPRGWCSIFSLMRDGRDLANRLFAAAELPRGNERERALEGCIDPYVQIVEPADTCQLTGLRLMDIWRYFRHTWTTFYQSTPGRKIWFLIRDRAAEFHPVIGIGALGSSIVQLGPRDRWIGWSGPEFIQHLRSSPTRKWAQWLEDALEGLLEGVYMEDFLREGLLTLADLAEPTTTVVDSLRAVSAEARRIHHLYPNRDQHKAGLGGDDAVDWKARAEMQLFRSKRALALSELLDARRKLRAGGFHDTSTESLSAVLTDREAVGAVQLVLRYMKASHVGVDMMDITICGAIAPYNTLLGGKLVAMLMASPDVIAAYNARYKSTPSVIASSMAGRAVRRKPALVFLGTTSLYDVASSQYNRLRVPAEEVGGRAGGRLEYVNLGRTVGFGSYQFSQQTMAALEVLLARSRRGRQVNSIFGEGVNPKLRKVRAALELAGLRSDLFLRHGSPRIVYGVALAENTRDVLLGRASRARYIVPLRPEGTVAIVAFWRRRWLSPRVERPDVLECVASHDLTYPVRHGARVLLPGVEDDEGPLFSAL
jgi:hypothetical protein